MPEVLREAHRLGATVDGRNAITVFWLLRRPALDVRGRVERCVFN
jgi:hypothetical protein